MARKAREKSSTGVYAVILRSEYDVFSETQMQELFTDIAKNYLSDELMGIKLQPRRAELLVRESENGISYDMKPIIISFARAYNREQNIDGKVFSDRFKSVPVETKALEKQCIAYLDGGDIAAPYERGRAKTRQKIEKPAEEKPSKPKKQKNLPTWLL